MNSQIENGDVPIPFTCKNIRYATDINVGRPHGLNDDGTARAGGSVKQLPIEQHNGFSLWLEHIKIVSGAISDTGPMYWLIWYDTDGRPTTSASAIFHQTAGLDNLLDALNGIKANQPVQPGFSDDVR